MTLSEGEARALLAAALLVLLAAVGRIWLRGPTAEMRATGIDPAGPGDSALAVAESAYALTQRRLEPLATGERIDPNRADEAELDRLPGVGPALARAILASRRRDGPFRDLADLERVAGLGSTTIRRLAPHLALPASAGPARTAHQGRVLPAERRSGAPLDLNRASAADLESLPGIGPVRARAIVRWREARGPFRNFEDLLEVPGIGPATVARLRSLSVVRP
ncbi:MAG: hypothetical protein GWN99_19145 [Gemmatimonadetes bacterium]|uniref:Helix-hairpin-helix DNA-binding motif class 1 domain-containing protein n=1 Tax=Candidatus Kutchimonas denitrificans TaxID=3056748 RepID=A0AAE4Z6T1_9BACT|nr:hypothetical protein [Gemmatimonadota bacterium]NIR73782.1 hypothetical protein [Candidatus Kutchimonas denitrificans]NIS03146.1 hypothetical protein [Gemmatimonadota bacterium]NIT69047.1 hypothetical protein [Gemmatimonadota bacterium]NIU54138.1 hypothetical protein [Gemmatimonadota bacterium]